jgi:cytochrome d ubiquinol oxidase subunit I
MAIVIAFVGSGLMFVSGDLQTREVQANQPLKFAAMEGICKTENGAALTIIAVPPGQDCTANASGIAVPNGLSAMSDLDPNGQIKGLDQESDTSLWPPVATIFVGFHLMVAVGSLMLLLMLIGVFFLWRRSVETHRWWLRAAVLAIPLPILAIELGWMVAEVGRQPWIVQGLMKTAAGVSPGVSSTDVAVTLVGILILYALLFSLWMYSLGKEIARGPEPAPGAADAATTASARGH